jgi:hypothetical protein
VKIETAGTSTGVVEVSFPRAARPVGALRVPDDDLIARHRARNALTWGVLERLGVREGAELALSFAFAGAGRAADRSLADHLRDELGYVAEVEPDGVSGRTLPMIVSPGLLDEWVSSMLGLGAFTGWTATVQRPAR